MTVEGYLKKGQFFKMTIKQKNQVKFHKKKKLSFIDKLLQNIVWTNLVTYLGKLTHVA